MRPKHFKPAKKKYVSFTFDDGPDRKYTLPILDVLKRFGVKATFFLVGKRAKRNPDIVQRIVKEGHEIGNHTYSHPVSPILRYRAIEKEIALTGKIITEITGQTTQLFRPTWSPWDFYCSRMEDIAQDLGYQSVRWSISSVDWLGIKGIIRHKIMNTPINSKEIFLFHDGAEKFPIVSRRATVEVLPHILHRNQKNNIHPLTLSEMLGV
ncbi:MAG: polysaccharide deacetylase family protein [Candidatus Omnitrophica bacterium]|nr:polysaccharide deacetylase family protein [Candidatus Omnitrophota bacterium]